MHYDLSSTVFQRTRGGGGDLIPAGPLNVVIGIGSIVFFLLYNLFAYKICFFQQKQYSFKMPLACYSKLPKSSKPEAIIKGIVSLYFRLSTSFLIQ